jgi:GT2 family glycosyltransferase
VLDTKAPGFELSVVVADNFSQDDSLVFLKAHPSYRDQLHIVAMTTNHGFAGGYNEALQRVEADYYVLLNSDVEVAGDWLSPLVNALEEDPGLGAVQPKMRWHRHPRQFEYAGAAGGFIDRLGYPFCRGRMFQSLERDEGQYDGPSPIFWASGAALCIRARLYHRLGGLDADFFAHMEEIDLCWRMQHAGYRIGYVPASVVYHVGGATLDSGSPRKTYLNFRNNLALLHKNLPPSEHGWVLAARVGLDLLAAAKDFAQGRKGHAGAIFRAWHDYLKRWRHWRRLRRGIRPRSMKTLPGVFCGSIVWEVFVRGKKRFSQLPPHRFVGQAEESETAQRDRASTWAKDGPR